MKILVDVLIPATGTVYNIRIPREASINQVLEQIKAAVVKMHEAAFVPDADTVLCTAEGNTLDVNSSVWKCGVGNGSRLMLI